MLLIGYRYESAYGTELVKAVICKDEEEYKKMRQKIKDNDSVELIEFTEVYRASRIL